MTYPENFSQIIQQSLSRREGKHPMRLLACGKLEHINSVVHQLHVLGFAEVLSWTPPVPSPVAGEAIRILTVYMDVQG